MHAMIDFYVASAVSSRRIRATTAPQISEKLERMICSLEKVSSVRVEAERIVGLDTVTLQQWWNDVSSKWKPATANNYICVLNPFFRWAHTMKSGDVRYLKDDVTGVLKTVTIPNVEDLPEEERPKDKYYTHDQVNELLFGSHGRNQVRDRAIMGLILYSGLRVSELCSLTIGQFRAQKGTIRLKRKGGAWANAKVGEEAYPLVEEYLATRSDASDPSRPLFITTHGKCCTREQVYKALSHKQKELGLAAAPTPCAIRSFQRPPISTALLLRVIWQIIRICVSQTGTHIQRKISVYRQ